jgi:sterol desaturase/sphingolipid hydroxylase (fatty acid hydroxylase superfamily)
LGSWLIENGSIFMLVWLKSAFLPKRNRHNLVQSMFTSFFGSLVLVEGAILTQHFLVTTVYEHIPYFSEKRAKPPVSEAASDWLSCNFIANVFTSTLSTVALKNVSETVWKTHQMQPFRPLGFLYKLAIMRLVVDMFFYAGHWLLHTQPFYWLHKRHHQHFATSLSTNFHFSALGAHRSSTNFPHQTR